jgi:ABC-type Fe3+-hydroxamate transport system substrate-binding protein
VRIVSLVPSATETLAAWGVEPIAVTRFCERPDLLAVGGTKNPDIAAIAALEPDLVVMNVEENRKVDAEALREAGCNVHVIAIDRVDDVMSQMDHLARAVRLEALPTPLAEWSAPPVPPAAIRAFVPIWRTPWMTMSADTYGASILRTVGIEALTLPTGDRYPTVTLDAIAALAPEVVLAPSEPYAFAERHRPELEMIAPMHFVDGKDIFWWGVRTPAAVERLREIAQTLRR